MSDDKKVTPAKVVAGEPDKVNGTTTLWVGCKLPNGLVCEMGTYGDENYRAVNLNGSNSATIAGGYGLTLVTAEFWNAWLAKHKHLSFVRKGLVFAHTDRASAEAHATERAEIKTGLEPIDPAKRIVNPETGATILEVDASHFAQGRRDVAQARQAAQRQAAQ